MPSQQLLGRFSIGADRADFAFDDLVGNSRTATLTSGKYFIAGYTSESAEQLVEHIQTNMQAETGFGAATCTYDAGTGLVTFEFAVNPTTLTFTDAALGTLLGFTGVQSGAAQYVGTTQARHVWRPQEQITRYSLLRATGYEPVSSSVVTVAPDGTSYSTAGSTRYEAVDEPLLWNTLPEADGPTPTSGTIYLDFEQFFKDVVGAGEQIRYYHDRSNNTATDYVTILAVASEGPGKPIGRLSSFMARTDEAFDGLWDVTLPIVKQQ